MLSYHCKGSSILCVCYPIVAFEKLAENLLQSSRQMHMLSGHVA
jgi:hypothetical protein